MVAALGGAAALQPRIGEANALRRENDFRWTPDPRVARVVAGAHRSTFADLLWLRTLPDMGRTFSDRALKKRWLVGSTDVITDLDPSFGTVYSYGAAYLTLIEKSADSAIALLQKGVRANPDCAGLYVALGMTYWEFKRDKRNAIRALESASRMEGCDSLTLAMLAALRVDEREDLVALYYWERTMKDGATKEIREVGELEHERTKRLIAVRAARDFAKAHGRAPAKAEELRDPKLMDPSVMDVVFDGLVIDDKGHPRYAKLELLSAERLVVQAAQWRKAFVEDNERAPTDAEFRGAFPRLPEPPPGRTWRVVDGRLSLE